MRKLFFIFLFSISVVSAQTIIERQVYGSAGKSEILNGTDYSYTIGEVVVTTETIGSTILTQGFQQPERITSPDSIVYELQNASCKDAKDGLIRIVSLPNCTLSALQVFFWNDGDTSRIKTNLAPGEYIANFICLTNPLDTIRDTIYVGLESEEPCLLKFYSGFTPNKDGSNDYWHIENIEVFMPNNVNIFNRWGDLVFTGENYDNVNVKWDGKDNKKNLQLPDGTYFYVATVQDIVYKGWVELTR